MTPTFTAQKCRKCKVCKSEFVPVKPVQSVCSYECAMAIGPSLRAKAEKMASIKDKRETKVKLEKFKTRAKWIAEAQTAFNAFVRTRDAGQPCICCGGYGNSHNGTGGTWDAGHYRSRGSAPHLRFDERNVHAQLKQCNRYESGNVVGYRMGLIARIGLQTVLELESDQAPRRHTIDELKSIKATYQSKTKALKASHDND